MNWIHIEDKKTSICMITFKKYRNYTRMRNREENQTKEKWWKTKKLF